MTRKMPRQFTRDDTDLSERINPTSDKPIDVSGVKADIQATRKPLTDSLSFGEAFRSARRDALSGGPKTFTWRGKSYGTQLAGEGSSTPARRSSGATPAAPTRRPTASAPSAPSKLQQDYDRGAAMRKSLTPTSERVTPDMIAAVRRFAGPDVPAYNAFGDRPSPEQQRKLAEARARGAANWKKAGETIASGKKKGGSVKKKPVKKSCGGGMTKGYAKGGSIDGCAVRGKTRAKRTK